MPREEFIVTISKKDQLNHGSLLGLEPWTLIEASVQAAKRISLQTPALNEATVVTLTPLDIDPLICTVGKDFLPVALINLITSYKLFENDIQKVKLDFIHAVQEELASRYVNIFVRVFWNDNDIGC